MKSSILAQSVHPVLPLFAMPPNGVWRRVRNKSGRFSPITIRAGLSLAAPGIRLRGTGMQPAVAIGGRQDYALILVVLFAVILTDALSRDSKPMHPPFGKLVT